MSSFLSRQSVVVLTLMVLGQASGHGLLWEPPSRSSMWRRGFDNPENWDDNGLNCGGVSTQYSVNGGKCGVCGDPWNQPQPRDNEAGGKYGNGIITRTYTPGQEIDVQINITANHKGWFEFSLCPHNDPTTPITQQCLDQHLLELADGSGNRYQLGPDLKIVHLRVKLPPGLTCSQCVLQWKWHAGNSYGTDDSGAGCVGCGNQEEFYGCSDVAIGQSTQNSTPVLPMSTTTQTQTPHHSHSSSSAALSDCRASGAWQGNAALDQYCQQTCPGAGCPSHTCSCSVVSTSPPPTTTTTVPTTTTTAKTTVYSTSKSTIVQPTPSPTPSSTNKCRAIGDWQGNGALDLYCEEACPGDGCPAQHCTCSSILAALIPTTRSSSTQTTTIAAQNNCHAVSDWQGSSRDSDTWCRDHCALGNCPPVYCSCDP